MHRFFVRQVGRVDEEVRVNRRVGGLLDVFEVVVRLFDGPADAIVPGLYILIAGVCPWLEECQTPISRGHRTLQLP
jgi:hypothetical protein